MTPEEQLALLYQKFPEVNEQQREQFSALWELYTDWNSKINVISRKDIDNLYMHHVLHSLGVTKMLHFTAGSHVIDVGTGGGFPGIPLAILFPEVQFTLVDSIGKKVRVAQSVAESLGLQNVTTHHIRIEELREKEIRIVIGDMVTWSNSHATFFLEKGTTPSPMASLPSRVGT